MVRGIGSFVWLAFLVAVEFQKGATMFARTLVVPLVILASTAAASAQEPAATAATLHPALFLVGDSIMKTGTGTGDRGPWGWGSELIPLFNPAKIHVYNEGRGGRSSRSYIAEGLWAENLGTIAARRFRDRSVRPQRCRQLAELSRPHLGQRERRRDARNRFAHGTKTNGAHVWLVSASIRRPTPKPRGRRS